jgi:hypothetical protein
VALKCFDKKTRLKKYRSNKQGLLIIFARERKVEGADLTNIFLSLVGGHLEKECCKCRFRLSGAFYDPITQNTNGMYDVNNFWDS